MSFTDEGDTIGIDVRNGVRVYTFGSFVATCIPLHLIHPGKSEDEMLRATLEPSVHGVYFVDAERVPQVHAYFQAQHEQV